MTNPNPTSSSVASSSAIASCTLLQDLLEDEREALLCDASIVQLESGERLFTFSEPLTRIYLIESGAVALTLPASIRGEEKEIVLETRREGSLVGWSALVKPFHSTLGAKAAEPTRAVTLARDAILKVFAEHPRIQQVTMANLTEIIAGRLRMFEALVLHDLRQLTAELA